jgi:hypothetical protein
MTRTFDCRCGKFALQELLYPEFDAGCKTLHRDQAVLVKLGRFGYNSSQQAVQPNVSTKAPSRLSRDGEPYNVKGQDPCPVCAYRP